MTKHSQTIDHIRDAVGEAGWIGPDDPGFAPYVTEQRGLFQGSCAGIVRPASTDEVARVVTLCAAAGLAIVPQGGNTGLVGGAVPDFPDGDGIVLATGRMNRIRHIDSLNRTMTVEAGVVLADIQAAATEAGALFPLSLGAEGSCQIGGNLSTNAGGVQVLHYGNARNLVLGLEVVLPDGRVWNGLRALRKDNTGYDLKHLFIGAEGTLGIITAAVLKLFSIPEARETVLCAAPDAAGLLTLFGRMQDAMGDSLTAFEIMNRFAVSITCRHIDAARDPFAGAHAEYALIEVSGPALGQKERLERVLAKALDDGLIDDAVIAASDAQASELWAIRENIPEAQKPEGGSIKHDISVPVSKVSEFLGKATAMMEAQLPGIRVCAFGHAGDGNIHFNLSRPEAMDTDAYMENRGPFNRLIHDLAMAMDGSFSAEHGIGKMKVGDLHRYKEDAEIDLMRSLKRALDPKGIMNPGKVVEVEYGEKAEKP